MKSIKWEITVWNPAGNEVLIYQSNIGPVDSNHVLTRPTVKEWLKGQHAEIRPILH